jgi:pimeloyl-ACP methyl ester carboxylesterase
MGGVFAPLVARQTSLKGIIAYGTFGSNLPEHLAKTRRTIAEAYRMAPDETDDYIRDFNECIGYYFIEKMSSTQAAAKNPGCRETLSVFDFRSRAYNDQLYALNFPAVWKPFAGKTLFVWGGSDYVSAQEDHRILTDAVNYYHPGHATLLVVPHASHSMQAAADFREAKDNPGPYNPEVGKQILSWLNKQQSS